MSLTQIVTSGRVLPTLVLSQQLGIALCAQTLMRQQSSLPTGNPEKGVALL